MIIHFIGNTKHLNEDLPFLQTIIDVAHDNGAVLARDWLGAAINNKASYSNDSKVDWGEVHAENISAFSRSDIMIVEGTRYSFQQGFFICQAIEYKKPVLVVARLDTSHPLFGVHDKFLTVKSYETTDELAKIVNKFIKSNIISTKDLRFNFFIDRQIYSYLREVSYETGRNKSEIIRDLLEQQINEKD